MSISNFPQLSNSSTAVPVAPVASASPVAAPSFIDQGVNQQLELQAAQALRKNAKIMIVDDEKLIISVVRRFLQADGYEHFVTLTESTQAIDTMLQEKPDAVLVDVNMPGLSGLDILRLRKQIPELKYTPFIVLSAVQDRDTKQQALELGATDFLAKPVEQVELKLRVQNTLLVKQHFDHLSNYAKDLENKVKERTRLLERSREQILQCLARAAEYRDNETGQHVIRVGKFSRIIAEQLGLPRTFCVQIEMAAPLHDLGKIGIPDSILLSPDKLSDDQFVAMKKHCEIGRKILDPFAAEEVELLRDPHVNKQELPETMRLPLLTMAARIAQTHHEKWDGTGYPLGLKGEAIPIEGRITAVADVYDALCSQRPYKPQYNIEKALEIMLSDRGTRFDPQVLDAFCEKLPTIEKIRRLFGDK